MTSELSWVAESLEGAIDLSDDVGCASSDVLVGNVVCRSDELEDQEKKK